MLIMNRRSVRGYLLQVAAASAAITLLALIAWYVATRADGSSSDEFVGVLVYSTLASSVLADAAYVLLARHKKIVARRWLSALETGLRLAGIVVLFASLVFLPIPGFLPDFPLIFGAICILLLYVMEVGWRAHMLSGFDQGANHHADFQLITWAIFAHLIAMLVVAALGVACAVFINAFMYYGYGPLAMQSASVLTAVIVPPVLLGATFVIYRVSRRCQYLLRSVKGTSLLLIAIVIVLQNTSPLGFDGRVTVTLLPDQPGYWIPPDFPGLSFEAPVLMGPAFAPSNTELVQLLRNLGPGTL